jgi:hypothetical protein
MANVNFPLGRIVATPGAIDAFTKGQLFQMLRRHSQGDWGQVDEHDWKANDTALIEGTRLLSAYVENDTKVWIITEADRSATTFLLPSEY